MFVFVLTTLICQLSLSFTDNVVLPSVVWDPRRPIFMCDNPILHVKLNDKLNFLCPQNEFFGYMASQKDVNSKLYENLYFLGTDEQGYLSCNATDGKLLLKCDGESVDVFNLVFRDTKTSEDSITFLPGQTYYVIGTGHRKKENLDNVIGGSCNSSEDSYNRLRLRIYICKPEEVESGQCDICQSEGCYYKDCLTTCSSWVDDRVKIFNSKNNCTMLRKRICVNQLLGKTEHEYQETPWPCDEKPVKGAAIVGSVQNSDDSGDKYKYIAIGLSIVTFIVGVVLGVVVYKYFHFKRCSHKINNNNNNNKAPVPGNMQGKDNANYRHSFNPAETFYDSK